MKTGKRGRPRKNFLSEKINPLKHAIHKEHYFLLCTGMYVRDYKELAEELEKADDSVFYYHVTQDRNDFATWIRDMFHMDDLADELLKAKSREQCVIIIYKYIVNKLW